MKKDASYRHISHQVPAATLLDGNTLTIGRTRILFWTGGEPDTDE